VGVEAAEPAEEHLAFHVEDVPGRDEPGDGAKLLAEAGIREHGGDRRRGIQRLDELGIVVDGLGQDVAGGGHERVLAVDRQELLHPRVTEVVLDSV
jgi:hypothetical protein